MNPDTDPWIRNARKEGGMSPRYADRGRRPRARFLTALAYAIAFVVATKLEVGGQVNPVATLLAAPPVPSATAESPPPLLMYDVRLALDQMERQA
jgi:hypothetical protein